VQAEHDEAQDADLHLAPAGMLVPLIDTSVYAVAHGPTPPMMMPSDARTASQKLSG
jgi:hypothetical protein